MLDINTQSFGLAKAESFDKNGGKKSEDAKLMEACRSFEALFMNQMMKQMRGTITEGGLIQKSKGEEMFTEMLDSMYCDNATQQGNGFGLAELMYKRMIDEKIAVEGDNAAEDPNLIYRKKQNPYGELQKASSKIAGLMA
jgi:flagellar protein FlgJ